MALYVIKHALQEEKQIHIRNKLWLDDISGLKHFLYNTKY